MKKLVLFSFVALLTFSLSAQITTPQASTAAKIWQTVGLTEVTVDYSRPSMRGRTIYGNLVPFDKLWRTGANAYTKVTFDKDVSIANQPVKAGTYSIFTKPGKTNWEVFVYTDTVGGGTPSDWDDAKVVAKATVPVSKIEMPVETFTMTIDDVTSSGANLGIIWENTYVALPFSVGTDAEVVKNIENVLGGPSAGDFYAAAVYYSNENKDINKAKEWMDKAMSMIENPRYWQLRQQSLILAKSGDKKGAISAAKKSLTGAEEAGNTDYVKLNKDSLKEWGAL